MTKIQPKQDSASPAISPDKQESNEWRSRIDEAFEDHSFRLAWDNDIGFHIARSLQELRRFRGLTQAQVAARAGTTQPKVALAESGDANLTARTLSRYIGALDGRLRFWIEPAEFNFTPAPPWWARIPSRHQGYGFFASFSSLMLEHEGGRITALASSAGVMQVSGGGNVVGRYETVTVQLNSQSADNFTVGNATLTPEAQGLLQPQPVSADD